MMQLVWMLAFMLIPIWIPLFTSLMGAFADKVNGTISTTRDGKSE